jgi:pimeloyl-ACP methyl ester carboxylesterase
MVIFEFCVTWIKTLKREFWDVRQVAQRALAANGSCILPCAFTRLFLYPPMAIMCAMAVESVHLNDIEMYYETEGAGEPLLLLHGGTGCQENWAYAGRDEFVRQYTLIKPDSRGHGWSTNPGKTITHRQCALDSLALLDHLGIRKCRAIGLSMGGNILLHIATLQPDRIEAMVLVSAAMQFPEQARAIMARVPSAADQPPQEWEIMRKRHKHGDEQIVALWDWTRGMSDSYDDMNFTPATLSKITASTLIVYGDRDPLYPVEMAVEMYRAIPRAALWIVPNAGHGPVFFDAAPQFAQNALAFFRTSADRQP